MASSTTESPASLWRHGDFMKLWAGQSLSLVGAQMTVGAMPVVAWVLLGASVTEMGVLGALARLPMVLFLVVGVWVDRMRRRPVLIWSDLIRAAVLGSVPVLFLMDMLVLWWLYIVVLIVGLFGVVFETAYRSYLPAIVESEHLGDGNGKLQMSESVARMVGPGAAGGLVTVIAAPLVIAIDVFTYLFSAAALSRIRKVEDKPEDAGGTLFAAIWDGLQWVMRQPLIRPLAIGSAVFSFFTMGVLMTIYFPFANAEAGVPPALVLATLAIGGVGAITGAWLAVRFMKSAGPGPTMMGATFVGNSFMLIVPFAVQPTWLAVTMLGVSQFVVLLCQQLFVVNNLTLLQTAAPRRLIGRVMATIMALGLIPAPVGALVAGLAGEAFGLRPTVLIASVLGAFIPMFVLYFSPIPKLKKMPEEPLTA